MNNGTYMAIYRNKIKEKPEKNNLMILTGVVFAAFHSTLPAVTQAALDSAKEAVTLCITMMGVMSFWVGLMKIAEKTGIIAGLSRRLAPVLHFLFPDIPKDHPANKYIATNMIANIFGLGWAATPAGLKAMEALAELEKERGKKAFSDGTVKKGERTASNEMCDFLIINISSLQIIPVNIIAYRSQYGSVNPAAIVGAGIVATTVSTLAGMVYCKIMDRKR